MSLGVGADVRGKTFSLAKVWLRGLYAILDGVGIPAQPKDQLQFHFVTGADGLVDIPATAGTYVIVPASDVPGGLALDVTNLAAYVNGTVAWAGGTAGNVSLSIQGTDGTLLATFTQAALTGSASNQNPTTYSISPGSTLATGVVDYNVRTIGASLPKNVGIVVVVSNSTSGSPVRLRLSGFAFPV